MAADISFGAEPVPSTPRVVFDRRYEFVAARPSSDQSPPLPECRPTVTDPAPIHARLAAVQAQPGAVLPKIELARCFDLTWQFEHVEQAVQQAQEALEAELAANPQTRPAGSLPLAGVDVPMPARLSGNPPRYPEVRQEDGSTGIVIVEARIDREGRVSDAR